ncbi:uncharacterized protein LY79DRAFT_215152 [Colletotrichum navitas]|uniref:Uncharacterized protein n=1 Tax=Colletotrichum navitas TaxID=681940 RepID=A0AAD8PZU0_9PEZI|nr:uncharacterized protein LY79DRAFT_215152 [Colletotrichum navitas]KAK1590604.1 hypothetical protein LY79DRAFT_215152 [Colletotrichum navitas]
MPLSQQLLEGHLSIPWWVNGSLAVMKCVLGNNTWARSAVKSRFTVSDRSLGSFTLSFRRQILMASSRSPKKLAGPMNRRPRHDCPLQSVNVGLRSSFLHRSRGMPAACFTGQMSPKSSGQVGIGQRPTVFNRPIEAFHESLDGPFAGSS